MTVDLGPRHNRLVSAMADEFRADWSDVDYTYAYGWYVGWKAAMKTMYPDADTFFKEDPSATNLICRTLAAEAVLKEKRKG